MLEKALLIALPIATILYTINMLRKKKTDNFPTARDARRIIENITKQKAWQDFLDETAYCINQAAARGDTKTMRTVPLAFYDYFCAFMEEKGYRIEKRMQYNMGTWVRICWDKENGDPIDETEDKPNDSCEALQRTYTNETERGD